MERRPQYITADSVPVDVLNIIVPDPDENNDVNLTQIEVTKAYSGAGSYQPYAVDLDLSAGTGKNTADGTAFLSPFMGNILGDALTKTGNYLAGVSGKYSITGTKATKYPSGGVLGIVADNGAASIPDAPIVAVLDGDSDVAKAIAFFKVRSLNSTAGTGADYGVDLFDSEAIGLGYRQNTINKALERSPHEVCRLEGDGAPVDGVSGTGAGFAGKGSQYTDYTNANLYLNAGTKASPTWKLVTRAA